MSVSEQQSTYIFPIKRFHIYSGDRHPSFFLSKIIIICKTSILIGLLITFFSDHWAIDSTSPKIYASYKNRCSVHLCLSYTDTDPVWLIDIAFLLAIINFNIEFFNMIIIYFCIGKALKLKIALEGLVFLSTFVLTDCLIIFGVCVSIHAYGLPMGYAYNCFVVSIVLSIIDWGCSLRRLIIDWPETLDLSETELSLDNDSATRIARLDRFT